MNTAAIAPEMGAVASPLWVCDRLIDMARRADRAGYGETADALVRLAMGLPVGRPAPWRSGPAAPAGRL
jgi:hypothetical protein